MTEGFDRVIEGAILKTIGIGSLAAVLCAVSISTSFALGVISGTAFGGLNLWVLAKVTQLIVERGRAKADGGHKNNGGFLSLVVIGQFVLVFVAAIGFLYVVGFKPVAFCVGFSSFLVGLAWQGLVENKSK